jgi:hypothetical protein
VSAGARPRPRASAPARRSFAVHGKLNIVPLRWKQAPFFLLSLDEKTSIIDGMDVFCGLLKTE